MPNRSWKRSRDAGIWQRLRPEQARAVLSACYGGEARAEVLLRAFLSERDRDDDAVRFWLSVHEAMRKTERTDS
jgi:hypothetical protein